MPEAKQTESEYLNSMKELSSLNLITDMKDVFMQRTESVLNTEFTFINESLKQLGISSKDFFSFISNTAMDELGSDILTEAIIEFKEIMDLGNQEESVINHFYARVEEAYIIAFQKDQKLVQRFLLNFMNSRIENSTKADKILIHTNEHNKQRAGIKGRLKKLVNRNAKD